LGRLKRVLLLALVVPLAAGTARAGEDHDEARDLYRSGAILPLERILAEAARAHPGRVLEVELKSRRGRRVYEVELLDERGDVHELRYDAASGELLDARREGD
jgi:uncharacterized membrane protein YkoI